MFLMAKQIKLKIKQLNKDKIKKNKQWKIL